MTPLQFDAWYDDLCRKFPAIGGWFRQLGDMQGGELLADWCRVLEPCDLADLLAVNQRMLAGDDGGPGNFPSDWQTLPARVRQLAFRERNRREAAHRQTNEERRQAVITSGRHRGLLLAQINAELAAAGFETIATDQDPIPRLTLLREPAEP